LDAAESEPGHQYRRALTSQPFFRALRRGSVFGNVRAVLAAP
jgi:hypothetical protein